MLYTLASFGTNVRWPDRLSLTNRALGSPKMRQLTTAKKMDNGPALTDAEYDVVRPVFNRHLYVSQQAHGAPLETAAEFWELSGGPAQRLAQIVHNRPLSSGGERRQPHPLRHLRDAQRRHIDEAADVVDLAELRDNEELAADL